MERILKRGDVVRRSIRGAKGFFYPDLQGKAILIREDCTGVEQTGWQDREDHKAFVVPTEVFSARDQYDDTPMMVIWVEMNG